MQSGNDCAGFAPWRPYMAALLKNERVTAKDHFQDTRHIELSLGDSGLTYKPGSVLAVFPQQDAQALAAFCKLARLKPDEWIRVEPEQGLGNGHSSSMEVSTGYQVREKSWNGLGFTTIAETLG